MSEVQRDRNADAHLARQLLRGGVGLRHVRRTLRELRDHREDLVQHRVAQGNDPVTAECEAHQLLGDQRELVARMTSRPELRSRARRFAWLLFVVGPVPMVFAAVLLLVLVLSGVGALLNAADLLVGRKDPELEVVFTKAVLQWVSPAIVGLLLCRAAIRRHIAAVWPLCALAMVSLAAGGTQVSGVDEVTGIAIGWLPLPAMARAGMVFGACAFAYLMMRRKPHAI
jgi:hypothetical protein